MKSNAKWALILAALAAFMHFQTGGGGSTPPSPTDTAAIAESVHRSRAARQAVVYRDIAARVESGVLATPAAAGTELVNRIAEIEKDVASPLNESAKQLPSDQWTDKTKSAQWFKDVATGFERIAK